MINYIFVSLAGGILFGIMDGVINANPLAQRLFEIYKPIARTAINATAGIVIDLVFSFIMAGVFLLLYASLPGQTGWMKGLSFALVAWFFRMVMSTASQWMIINMPPKTLLYILITGLGEMLVLGVLFGIALRPSA